VELPITDDGGGDKGRSFSSLIGPLLGFLECTPTNLGSCAASSFYSMVRQGSTTHGKKGPPPTRVLVGLRGRPGPGLNRSGAEI
jgi:hypothetical protein